MHLADAEIQWSPEPLGPGVRIGRAGSRVVVDWPGTGRLVASPDGREHEFSPDVGADEMELAKFRATSLLACERYLQGGLSLHGSAVRFPSGEALVLVGDSGAGKSTTAMALVELQGAEFLADDIVPVDWQGETPLVSPVDDTFWLDGAALGWLGAPATSVKKRRHMPRVRASGAARLHAVVDLSFDKAATGVTVEPLTGQEAFLVMSRAQACYSVGQADAVVHDLALRARTAVGTHLYRLRRRRSFDDLAQTARALATLVAEGGRP
jgi:hypothetical protein